MKKITAEMPYEEVFGIIKVQCDKVSTGLDKSYPGLVSWWSLMDNSLYKLWKIMDQVADIRGWKEK